VALTLLFINVKVNQPVNLTPFLAPLNYVSILAPAQIQHKSFSNRLKTNNRKSQPLRVSRFFLSGCIEKGLLKIMTLWIPMLVPHYFISIRPNYIRHKIRYSLCSLKQAVYKQPEILAASSIPIFSSG